MHPPEARVSVIMTCYNEGAYIGAAVASVLRQTRADLIDRIIISDDGSGAATLDVLAEIETWDPRIAILYGPGGAGISAQRNRALALSDAPLFAILDGDDIWADEKLERQLPLLADASIALVYSDYCVFPDGDLGAARRAGVRDLSGARDLARLYFLRDGPIIPSTAMIRRSAFDSCGGFDEEVKVFEDTDLFLRLTRCGRFALCDAPLLYKRQHPSSITGGKRDLMAHHAFVAQRAAAANPSLGPLVRRRLSERARKLSNHALITGGGDKCLRLAQQAIGYNPLNARAWASLAAGAFDRFVLRSAIAHLFAARRAALGLSAEEADSRAGG